MLKNRTVENLLKVKRTKSGLIFHYLRLLNLEFHVAGKKWLLDILFCEKDQDKEEMMNPVL